MIEGNVEERTGHAGKGAASSVGSGVGGGGSVG